VAPPQFKAKKRSAPVARRSYGSPCAFVACALPFNALTRKLLMISNCKPPRRCRLALTSIATVAGLAAPLFAFSTAAQASHHNDAPTAKKDSRLNLTDLYVFPSRDGKATVFVVNVVKDAGRDGAKHLHPDAVYDVAVDMDGDFVEDTRLRFRFDPPAADGTQSWSVSRVEGAAASSGTLVTAAALGGAKSLGEAVTLPGGGRAWAGIAGDAFVANAAGYFKLMDSVKAGKADFTAFDKPANYFAETDVISLVVEVPNEAFKKPDLNVWASIATVSGKEITQVSRWGNVLTAFIFASQPEDAEAMNRSQPRQDRELHRARAAQRVSSIVKAAGTASDPVAYGQAVAARLMPMVMPYRVGTPAVYGIGQLNGRALSDDAFDVIMSTVSNRTINDGVTPGRMRDDFPYVPVSRRIEPWVSGR
jgi:hypothetical protein